jgi:hypothetical protein
MNLKRNKKKMLKKLVQFLVEDDSTLTGLQEVATEFDWLSVQNLKPKNPTIEEVREVLRRMDLEELGERIDAQLGNVGLEEMNKKLRKKMRDRGLDPDQD